MPDHDQREDMAMREQDMPVYARPETRFEWMVDLPNVTTEKDLCRWLRTATDDLCGQAKLRIYSEVYAHYLEAVADEKAQGRTEEDARRAALASLGDPEKTWNAFCNVYLTEQEAKQLTERISGTRWGKWRPFYWMLIVLTLASAFFMGRVSSGNPRHAFCVLCAYLVSFFVWEWLCPRLTRDGHPLRSLVWSLVANIFPVVALQWCGRVSFTFHVISSIALVAFGSFFFAFLFLPTILKLRRHPEFYDAFHGDDDGGRYA